MAWVLGSPWVARPWRRRLVVGVLVLVLGILSLFPKPYFVDTLLAPDDSAAGLASLFGGGGGGNLLASLLGGHGSIEADLLIARSEIVMDTVAQRLHEQHLYRKVTLPQLAAKLRKTVTIEAIRGSVLEISMTGHNRDTTLRVVNDFADVLRGRLTTLSRLQALQKRTVARERMNEATIELNQAQATMNAFRAAHKFAGPDVQLGAGLQSEIKLQGELEASRTALLTLQKVEGPENIQVQTLQQRVLVLTQQIHDIQSKQAGGGASSLSTLNPEVTQYQNLGRDQAFAEAQYDIYRRYSDALVVQEVAAPLNMDVIDPPYVDPARHFNAAPLAAFVLMILFGLIAEVYVPPIIRSR